MSLLEETLMSNLIYLIMQQKLVQKMNHMFMHVCVGNFTLKSNLASGKTEVDKLDADKLTSAPNDLTKLSNVVKNGVVEKTVYEKLVAKVNKIDTTGFFLMTTYDADKSHLEKKISDGDKKIPDTCELAKKADLNGKITEKK